MLKLRDAGAFARFLFDTKFYMGLETSFGKQMEAAFVGRDSELRLLKDLYHATARERRVRLVSITGQGGVGKSRLAWELKKYADGVVEDVWWHEGR